MKIQLGGGEIKLEGYTNIDILALLSVDIVHDLNTGIPLEDNSVEEVYADNCLEHLKDTCFIMEEIYRVCKPGAKVFIAVPYAQGDGAFKDPTHVAFFTENTFKYFDKRSNLPDYQLKCDFRVKKLWYKFYQSGWKGRILNNSICKRYLWNIVKTIYVELVVNKAG